MPSTITKHVTLTFWEFDIITSRQEFFIPCQCRMIVYGNFILMDIMLFWIYLPLLVNHSKFWIVLAQSYQVDSSGEDITETTPEHVCRSMPIAISNPFTRQTKFRCCRGWELVEEQRCLLACPTDYERGYDDKCYKYSRTPLSWVEARRNCQTTEQSDLVVIESREENEFLVSKLLHTAGYLDTTWIVFVTNDSTPYQDLEIGAITNQAHHTSGIRVIPYINTLVWVDGSRSSEIDQLFISRNDTEEEEESSFTEPKCLALNQQTALWDHVRCSTRKHYVCKLRSQCPRGYRIDFKGHCYKYVTSERATWTVARHKCQEAPGGELAIADDDPPNETAFLLNSVHPNVMEIWLGLYHDRAGGRWRWVDGSELLINHTVGWPWNDGEPRYTDEQDDCAEITFSGKWSNTNCQQTFSYVCEVQTNGECYKFPDGKDYNGRVNLTESGLQCLPWRDTVLVTNNLTINVSALAAEGHNYCRNPAPGTMITPWCLVEDDDDGARWEYCYVGEYQMRCLQGLTYATPCTDQTCDVGRICHPVIRQCICPAGFGGENCDERCDDGFFGFDCENPCRNCPNREICHHVTGRCPSDVRGGNNRVGADDIGTCSGICSLAIKLGCKCSPETGKCPCPGYVISLFVVSLMTWFILGLTCVACWVRRKRHGRPVEYKRDSDYCEDMDSDESETEEQRFETSVFGITPAQSNSHSLDQPFQPLHERSGINHISNRSYGSRECLHQNRNDCGQQIAHSHNDAPYYLNMHADDRDSSCDYSHPYDYLNKETRWRSSAPGLDEFPHPFVLRACQDQDELNKASHGYVNDSVARLKGRKLSKKLSHGQLIRNQFPFKKKTSAHATPSLPVTAKATQRSGPGLKPALKPKPDLRIRQLAGFGRAAHPIPGSAEKSSEFTSSSPGPTPKHPKRRTVRRGISVPTMVDDELPPRPDIYNRDDRHVYQNEHIGRPNTGRPTRVAKARSVDMFGAV